MVNPPPWAWDELVLVCDVVASNGWKKIRLSDPQAQQLSELLQLLPLHPPAERGSSFRSVGAVSFKSTNLETAHPGYSREPTRGGSLDGEVVRAFMTRPAEMHSAATLIRAGISSGDLAQLTDPAADESDDQLPTAPEGRLLARRHSVRERNPRLRRQKIKAVLATTGTLRCDVCSFNFESTYGEHGLGYIEVHHIVPLHQSGETTTRLEDLALLCANCHRMCHRQLPSGTWPTPAQLQQLLQRGQFVR